MEIVINTCYGGFGLSHEAIMRYAELKGIKLYSYIEKRDEKGNLNNKYELYTEQEKPFIIYYATKPLGKNGDFQKNSLKNSFLHDSEIERTDPVLIKVVKELKGKANGRFARLKVIEIPDDIKYEIDEYDGIESIHEQHESWG